MKKRLLSGLIMIGMLLTMMPTVSFASGEARNSTVYDLSDDTTVHTITTDCTLTGKTTQQVVLQGGDDGITVTLDAVDIHVSNNSGVKIQGNVTLNLQNESTVEGGNAPRTGYAGVEVENDAHLTITGTGTLTALAGAGMQHVSGSNSYDQYARGGDGIGGNGKEINGPAPSGDFTLESGTVIAKGMADGSGIGCESITISGGNLDVAVVRADKINYLQPNSDGSGLGGSDTSRVFIADGQVTASGESLTEGEYISQAISAAEIEIAGGTVDAVGTGAVISSNITIGDDAVVNAQSMGSLPGIGNQNSSSEGPLHITIQGNADVTASGGKYSAGIGGVSSYSTAQAQPIDIQILGNASVNATGGTSDGIYPAGAGIGSGAEASSGEADHQILINTTGSVYAVGGELPENRNPGSAAGIGGSAENGGGTIIIQNGNITAIGGQSDWGGGAGIGGGSLGSSGNITISGGTLHVTGGNYAAAIGSGYGADVDRIEISGGNVNAFGGPYGAAIGSGQSGAAGEIVISGGTTKAYAVESGYGVAIGSGYAGGSGMVTISDGTVWAIGKGEKYASLAIGGRSVDVPVSISASANVYAFSGSLASATQKAHHAIPVFAEGSSASVIQGIFAQSYPIRLNQSLKINGISLNIPEEVADELGTSRYWGFALTVPSSGENYQLTKTEDGKNYAATHGSGDAASNKLSTSTRYENLYWSEVDESGKPVDTIEPDPVEPDESWMDDYKGTASYDETTGVTTITGSITDGKYLYVIPKETTGKVILDGTGYIDALISQYVNKTGLLWTPGSASSDLPIVIKNESQMKYSYADATFGLDEDAEAKEHYHIASTFDGQRLNQDNDKQILRTMCQPIQDLLSKTGDNMSIADLMSVEDKVKELDYDSFADYALNYYKTRYSDAANATSLLDLPVKYQLNLMGYASARFDYPNDLRQGNMGTSMSTSAVESFINSLTEEQKANIIRIDYENDTTGLFLLETDPEIQEMGRMVAYKYGIAFTFNSGIYPIQTGDSGNTEENLKYLNEVQGWTALMNADLEASALQSDNLSGSQEVIANTAGKIALMPGETDTTSMPRGQLSMPGYAVPNAMFSTAMLRGLTMQIELDASILIEPADITIYTGGTGYDSVVNGSGDAIGSTTNGLPTPGFYITLPDDVNQWLQTVANPAISRKPRTARLLTCPTT